MDDEPCLQIVNVVSLQDPAVPGTSKASPDPPEKPLFHLIKHLLNFIDNESNTFLTNAQLIDILKKEFDIDTKSLHNLEIEIYINILKKFLKTWPRWDIVDVFIQNAKLDSTNIEAQLYEEYENLKSYLQTMLNLAKPGAKDAVAQVTQCIKTGKTEAKPTLTVTCTKEQLYNLFLEEPDDKSTIFNCNIKIPAKIFIRPVYIDEIVNWPCTSVDFNIGFLTYHIKNYDERKYLLVNKKINKSNPHIETSNIVYKKGKRQKESVYNGIILEAIKNALAHLNISKSQNSYDNKLKMLLLQIAKQDLSKIPSISRLEQYKYYLNKYIYTRCHVNKVEKRNVPNPSYQLVLEESLSPSVSFSVDSFNQFYSRVENTCEVNIVCYACAISFDILTLEGVKSVKAHFQDTHCNEQDWTCPNCSITFPVQTLLFMRWKHTCFLEPDDQSVFDRI